MITGKFTFEAGVLVRNLAVSRIKSLAFSHDLDITIDEDRGFFSSNYRVKFSGKDKNVYAFRDRLHQLLRELEND